MRIASLIFFLSMIIFSVNSAYLRARAKQAYASSQLIVKDIDTNIPDVNNIDEFIKYVENQPERCRSGNDFNFSNYNGRKPCGGANQNLGIIMKFNFCVPDDSGDVIFYVGADLHASLSYFNDDVSVAITRGDFWADKWTHPDVWKVSSHLQSGKHSFTVIGVEPCCDGDGQVFYQTGTTTPRAASLENFSEDCKIYEENLKSKQISPISSISQLIIKNADGNFVPSSNKQDFINYVNNQPERCKSDNQFDFSLYNSRTICGGSNQNIGAIINITFCLAKSESVTFYLGLDSHDALTYFDGNVDSATTHGDFWADNWNHPEIWAVSSSLTQGTHTLTVMYVEGCCDGDGKLNYKTDSNPTPRIVNKTNLDEDCKKLEQELGLVSGPSTTVPVIETPFPITDTINTVPTIHDDSGATKESAEVANGEQAEIVEQAATGNPEAMAEVLEQLNQSTGTTQEESQASTGEQHAEVIEQAATGNPEAMAEVLEQLNQSTGTTQEESHASNSEQAAGEQHTEIVEQAATGNPEAMAEVLEQLNQSTGTTQEESHASTGVQAAGEQHTEIVEQAASGNPEAMAEVLEQLNQSTGTTQEESHASTGEQHAEVIEQAATGNPEAMAEVLEQLNQSTGTTQEESHVATGEQTASIDQTTNGDHTNNVDKPAIAENPEQTLNH